MELYGDQGVGAAFLRGGGLDCTIPWGSGQLKPTLYVALVGDTAKGRKSTALNDVLELAVHPTLERLRLDADQLPPFEVLTGMGSGEGFLEVLADRDQNERGGGGKQTGRGSRRRARTRRATGQDRPRAGGLEARFFCSTVSRRPASYLSHPSTRVKPRTPR